MPDDYIIDDPLWAELAINSAATAGLFVWEYYKKRFDSEEAKTENEASGWDAIPF